MTESLTLYKLIILYMLDQVNFPLTNGQLSSFLLEKDYTNYFNVQQAIGDLLETKLIRSETIRNSTRYRITGSGSDTLACLITKLSPAIRRDIDQYLRANRLALRNEVSVTADFYKNTNGEYTVRCSVTEKNGELIGLTLSVPDRKQAADICDHWEAKSQKIYQNIIEELLPNPQTPETETP